MNTTEKLLLVEEARAEFERNVKAALNTDSIAVAVNVFTSADMLDESPTEWLRDSVGDLGWSTSKSGTSGVSVFGKIEVQE
jgi:hypothetical protein